MRFISLPISDLVSYITDNIDEWPAGYNLETGQESQTIIGAAAAFATQYIFSGLPHMAEKAKDPIESMLDALGYPIHHMSYEHVEDLCDQLDDHFLSMTSILDVTIDGIAEFLKNKEVSASHKPGCEDIIITIDDDIRLVRMRKANEKLKQLMPPKKITAKNIDDAELAVGRFMRTAFAAATSEAVRVELKRIFDEEIKRH